MDIQRVVVKAEDIVKTYNSGDISPFPFDATQEANSDLLIYKVSFSRQEK